MPDEKLTQMESEQGFKFPETVNVPPCGGMYPDGVVLKLNRVFLDEGDDDFDGGGAFYEGSPKHDEDSSVMVMVEPDRDWQGQEIPLRFDVYTAAHHDRETHGVEKREPRPLPIGNWKEWRPRHTNIELLARASKPQEIPRSISETVERVAWLQGASLQTAIVEWDLSVEKEIRTGRSEDGVSR